MNCPIHGNKLKSTPILKIAGNQTKEIGMNRYCPVRGCHYEVDGKWFVQDVKDKYQVYLRYLGERFLKTKK